MLDFFQAFHVSLLGSYRLSFIEELYDVIMDSLTMISNILQITDVRLTCNYWPHFWRPSCGLVK